MIVSKILVELGVTDFSLNGEPTNEDEFNLMFKKAVGVDKHGTAIMSNDPKDFGVTWNQVVEKRNSTQYQRDRAVAFDPIPEQLDQIYHDIDGWKAKIKAVKDKYPKPT